MALAVVVTVLVVRGDHEVEPPRVDVVRANPAGAAAALRDLVEVLDSGDAEAAAGLAPDGEPDARALLAAVARNAREIDLADLSARYVDQVGPVRADGSWSAAVDLTWRYAGFDHEAARAEVLVHFVPHDGQVHVAGFEGQPDDGRVTPLWLHGPMSVARREGVLVVADAARDLADRVLARATKGIEVVARTLPRWSSAVVIEVPASGAVLDETLGAAPGTYADIAAVTAVVDGSGRAGAPTRVLVNPEVSGRLRPAGAQVVMSHEIAHLATGAATSTMEVWLLEGFADFVALRGTSLPDEVTLARARALVRRDGPPEALPGAAEFDTRAADLEAAYEMAWLACRVIAEQAGEESLVSLYRDVDAGVPLGRALAARGLAEQRLLGLWQERLQDLAA